MEGYNATYTGESSMPSIAPAVANIRIRVKKADSATVLNRGDLLFARLVDLAANSKLRRVGESCTQMFDVQQKPIYVNNTPIETFTIPIILSEAVTTFSALNDKEYRYADAAIILSGTDIVRLEPRATKEFPPGSLVTIRAVNADHAGGDLATAKDVGKNDGGSLEIIKQEKWNATVYANDADNATLAGWREVIGYTSTSVQPGDCEVMVMFMNMPAATIAKTPRVP